MKTIAQKRAECKKKGLVYDTKTKRCRKSKRGKKVKSPKKSPKKKVKSPKKSPKKSGKKTKNTKVWYPTNFHATVVQYKTGGDGTEIAINGDGKKLMKYVTKKQLIDAANYEIDLMRENGNKGLRKVNNRSKLETIWKSLSKTHLGRLEISNKSKTVKINIK